MNRREFLARFLATAAGVALAPTLDLEKLLWVPGEKTIFLPPPKAVDAFMSVEWIAKEILRQLEQNLQWMPYMYNNLPTSYDLRLGDTVQVRLPTRYELHKPASWGLTRIKTVPLDQQIGVSFTDPGAGDVAAAAADAIAHRMHETGVNVVAAQTVPSRLPTGVDEACVVTGPSGITLRGLRANGETRIDLIGGILP